MRSTVTSPTSASKSSSTTVEYFPGCRKDSNCNCSLCIVSMIAAFDLMTENAQISTLSKLSSLKRRYLPRSPVSFNSSSFSTPDSSSPNSGSFSRVLDSGSRSIFHDRKKRKERNVGFGVLMMWVLFGLGLIIWFGLGVSPILSGVLGPELSLDVVRNLEGKFTGFNDLKERLNFMKNELPRLVEEDVSNCSSVSSMWKPDQDGLLLNSRCTSLYKFTEEVAIWGSPFQRAGVLTGAYCSRSFTLLLGRLTEWKNGEMGYSIRSVTSSWTQERWSSSAVQLDPNVWILEYSEFPIRGNTKQVSAFLEFLKFKIARVLKRLKQKFWLSLFVIRRSHVHELGAQHFRIPP